MASLTRRVRRHLPPALKEFEVKGQKYKVRTGIAHGHKVPLFPLLDAVTRRQVKNKERKASNPPDPARAAASRARRKRERGTVRAIARGVEFFKP